jgi:class 3 adenylate cyclase/tetratricopeptide (TPR) repeat protein
VTCPQCGAASPADAHYCDTCGSALGPRPVIPGHLAAKIRAGREELEGELKQVTVLFVDVVGSMDLEEHTDPEQWRALMHRLFGLLCDGVNRFEGTVDKFTGDGIMAIFGAPIAHEDHARRACYAALEMQRALRREEGLGLAVRIGLNSGEVVVGAVGEDLAMTYTAIGHTVGLAQRMESLAEPGRVYLTAHTAALVDGFVDLQDLGEFDVKGVSAPLRVYELAGAGPAGDRIAAGRRRGLTRFVGREEELALLERAFDRAREGQGRIVGIVGEPGVGKSRLCHEFMERFRSDGVPVFHVAGQAHARSVPLLPVLELLRSYFGIGERDAAETARELIVGKLMDLDRWFDDELPLIFDFLGIGDPARPPPRLDPEARERRLLAVMKRLVRAQSSRRPGVTVVEDLQWLDPASETFLTNQVEAVSGSRSLLVVNFRPDYRAAWMSRSHYSQIALSSLGEAAGSELLEELLGRDPSVEDAGRVIRERTQGNPFFMEELVAALAEGGQLSGERGAYTCAARVVEGTVPASVQATLAARIDRLSAIDKAVLQAAAVIGKEIPVPVLERLVELEPPALHAAVAGLVAREFVYEQDTGPETVYAFKHPLTREVAYQSQLSERRRRLHAEVARATAELYPDRLDERAALVAEHWQAAGEPLEAARWSARAAAWAGIGHPSQALEHWGNVRRLTDAAGESDEASALGLAARIFMLQFAWRVGMQDEAATVFEEALDIAGDADLGSRAILLGSYGAVRGLADGDVREFAKLQREGLALAEQAGDPALYMALAPGAYAFFCAGRYREAVEVCDRAIEMAAGDETIGGGLNYVCPYAWAHGFKGLMLVTLGRLDEGARLIERSRELAAAHGDEEVVAFSYLYETYVASFTGDADAALRAALRTRELAEQIGNSFIRAYAWFVLGLAESMRGNWQPAIDALKQSATIAREGHTAIEIDSGQPLLAECYAGLGDVARARVEVARGLATSHERGHVLNEMFGAVGLMRVLVASEDATVREVDAAFARALELIRETEGRGFEPLIRLEMAAWAAKNDDRTAYEHELGEAQRLFRECGAHERAESIEEELAISR